MPRSKYVLDTKRLQIIVFFPSLTFFSVFFFVCDKKFYGYFYWPFYVGYFLTEKAQCRQFYLFFIKVNFRKKYLVAIKSSKSRILACRRESVMDFKAFFAFYVLFATFFQLQVLRTFYVSWSVKYRSFFFFW